jgi:uncharacterized protein YcfJ
LQKFAGTLESEEIKMRKELIASALLASSFSLPVMANDEYFDQARVVAVTPQYERVNFPEESCHTEYVRESRYSNERSPVGAIIGGVAGGLLGSQIGRGSGRVAGAAVGAGIGAVVGDRIGQNQSKTVASRPVERCVVTDHWQTVNKGYLVTYHYNGRDYTTILDHDPGRTLPVRVSVTPSHGVSSIGYYQHHYTSPTAFIPGHPAAQPYAYNMQFDYRNEGGRDWKKGRDKYYRHNGKERRYY